MAIFVAARRVSEEEAGDGFGDGKAGGAFEPEEFAAGIEFEKNVFPVWCEDDVDGAVVQREVIHEAQELFFDVERELIWLPVLNHADAIAPPVVCRARGDLRIDRG